MLAYYYNSGQNSNQISGNVPLKVIMSDIFGILGKFLMVLKENGDKSGVNAEPKLKNLLF